MRNAIVTVSIVVGIWGALSLAPGCGGGGGSPGASTLVLSGDGVRDGSATVTGVRYAGALVQLRPAIASGKLGGLPENAIRGFFSFDYAPLPSGITIDSAFLWLYESGPLVGAFGDLPPDPASGAMLIDHLQYGNLDGSDFDVAPITSTVAWLASFSVLVTGEYKTFNVSSAVIDDFAHGRPRAQFRVRFSDESPSTTFGGVTFTDGEFAVSTGGPGPLLFVNYFKN